MADSAHNRELTIVKGTQLEAYAWVKNSHLPDIQKQNLDQLIEHFPGLVFYRTPAHRLNTPKETEFNKAPQWLAAIQHILTYVMPDEIVLAQFDNVEDENWYMLYVGTYRIDVAYFGLEKYLQEVDLSLYPIGERVDMPNVILAVNSLNPEDQGVYEFNLESLWDSKRENLPPSSVIYRIFDSYPEMLAHIEAFKIGERGQEALVESVS